MTFVSKLLKYIATASLLLSSVGVHAGSTSFDQCPQFFANGKSPVIRATQQDMKPRALCFDGFAVLHSGSSHSPVYVAERLNRAMIEKDIERTDQFYAEARLPNCERAQLDDYRSSGYDRGHMAPAADMATDDAMAHPLTGTAAAPGPSRNCPGFAHKRTAWAPLPGRDDCPHPQTAVGRHGPLRQGSETEISRDRISVGITFGYLIDLIGRLKIMQEIAKDLVRDKFGKWVRHSFGNKNLLAFLTLSLLFSNSYLCC